MLTAASAILVALASAASHAESPPVRPAPPEKAPDAKHPIKIFGTGTFQPLAPVQPPESTEAQPLSLAQKSQLIGRDAGSHHVTLTIAKPLVQDKAWLAFLDVPGVHPFQNKAVLLAEKSVVLLFLKTQANKTYWIEAIVGRRYANENCDGFRVRGPDKSTQDFSCTEAFRNKKGAQHLLFGFSAANSGTHNFELVAKQQTEVYRFEITVQ